MKYFIDYNLCIHDRDNHRRVRLSLEDDPIAFKPHEGLIIAFAVNERIDIDAKVTSVKWFHAVGDQKNFEAEVVGTLNDWSKIDSVIEDLKKKGWTLYCH